MLAAFAVLASLGCGQAIPPAERQERNAGLEEAEASSPPAPTTPSADSAGGTPVGEAFAEAELSAVGDSGVSGDVVFKEVGSLGVQLELKVSGLPDPGGAYIAQVHEGSCTEVPKGDDRQHGHEHELGRGGPALALVRLNRSLSGREEYADHTEYEDPPADELPGNIDSSLSVGPSHDGTLAVTSLLEGVKPKQLSSGVPKYIDLRVPNEEPSEEWPALACADLGEGSS